MSEERCLQSEAARRRGFHPAPPRGTARKRPRFRPCEAVDGNPPQLPSAESRHHPITFPRPVGLGQQVLGRATVKRPPRTKAAHELSKNFFEKLSSAARRSPACSKNTVAHFPTGQKRPLRNGQPRTGTAVPPPHPHPPHLDVEIRAHWALVLAHQEGLVSLVPEHTHQTRQNHAHTRGKTWLRVRVGNYGSDEPGLKKITSGFVSAVGRSESSSRDSTGCALSRGNDNTSKTQEQASHRELLHLHSRQHPPAAKTTGRRPPVLREAVLLAEDAHRPEPQLVPRPHDPHRDLPAVGGENRREGHVELAPVPGGLHRRRREVAPPRRRRCHDWAGPTDLGFDDRGSGFSASQRGGERCFCQEPCKM